MSTEALRALVKSWDLKPWDGRCEQKVIDTCEGRIRSAIANVNRAIKEREAHKLALSRMELKVSELLLSGDDSKVDIASPLALAMYGLGKLRLSDYLTIAYVTHFLEDPRRELQYPCAHRRRAVLLACKRACTAAVFYMRDVLDKDEIRLARLNKFGARVRSAIRKFIARMHAARELK